MTDVHSGGAQRRNQPNPAPAAASPAAADIAQRPVVRRRTDGGAEVKGRNDEVLSRRRTGNTDPYAIPPQIIPDGWVYQWNAVTVHGSAEPVSNQMQTMWLNGWRAVPAERHDGVFTPTGATGEVLRGGQRLEERPRQLQEEAKQEEDARAIAQVRDQNAQYASFRNKLARGFDGRHFLPGGQGVRTGIDAAVDAPRARYEIDHD